jgi:hypothetical protein
MKFSNLRVLTIFAAFSLVSFAHSVHAVTLG